MGIIIGIIVAVIAWQLFKFSLTALIWLVVIGAILGAIPTFMRRAKRG